MPAVPEIHVNGQYYGHSNLRLKINGSTGTLPMVGVKEINWENAIDVQSVQGTLMQAIGSVDSKYAPKADMTLYLPHYDWLVEQLGDGFMAKRFDIDLSYRAEGLPFRFDYIRGAKIMKTSKKSGGGDAIEVKLDLHVMWITENGVAPIPNLIRG